MIPVETGPIIAPALQVANQIREGRARVSMLETEAKGYPEEVAIRRSMLGEQLKSAPVDRRKKELDIEHAGTQEARAASQEERTAKQDKRQQWADANKMYETALPRMRDARSHNVAVRSIAERTGVPVEELGGLLEENMKQEDFVKHMEKMIPTFYEAQYKHGLEMEEIEARNKGQEKVANVYAKSRADEAAENREADRLKNQGIDNATIRGILQDSRTEYGAENYKNVGTEENPIWEKLPTAISYEKWLPKYIKRAVSAYSQAKQLGNPSNKREPLEY